MADLVLKTDKGTFSAFGGPSIDCVAIPYGSKTIYVHATDGKIVASKDAPAAPEPAPAPKPPAEPEPAPEPEPEPAETEGDDA